jgi:hypothetical protein
VVSETEEDAEEDNGQNQFDGSVSDDGDLERLAEHIRNGRMGRTHNYGHDHESPLPSARVPELWMLRTTVRTVVLHLFRR